LQPLEHWLKKLNRRTENRLSRMTKTNFTQSCPRYLYFHWPCCSKKCHYCDFVAFQSHEKYQDAYHETLCGEVSSFGDMVQDADKSIKTIFFGGGTPTFLSVAQIQEVLELVAQSFHLGLPQRLEMGIEIDPRSVSVEDLERLVELGFNRFSFGVQDLNPEVQKAVNREQCFEKIKQLVQRARELHVKSISFDLIYGLPLQTPETFHQTLMEVMDVKPDRLALYNYAHMPDRMPAQRLINSDDLPSGEQKLTILSDSILSLSKAGYEYIGMDHFALPDDSLAKAQKDGSLQRNFQGYSTHAEADLVGLGVSAISRINESYSQNALKISAYTEKLANAQIPVVKGLVMSRDDVVRADLIQRLMCGEYINIETFSAQHDLIFEQYFQGDMQRLEAFVEDGLVNVDASGFQVTELGRVFLRNIAMCFDHYLVATPSDNSQTLRYSKTV